MKTDPLARTPAVHPSPGARGVQDRAGWGLLGLTFGILAGFALSMYVLIPLFPKTDTTGSLTVMTAIAVAAMTVGGTLGYLATRRR